MFDGVELSKIRIFGIFVEKFFFFYRDKDIVFFELNLFFDKLIVLFMGGSFGVGNIKEIFDELLDIDRDF